MSGLPSEIEDKSYPRDAWQRGRLRIKLKNDDGTFVNPEITTRRQVHTHTHL